MKVYNIGNFEALFMALDSCESDVVLTTEDGCEYSWRTQSGTFRSLAGSLRAGQLRQLGLRASGTDSRRLMESMMCARMRTA